MNRKLVNMFKAIFIVSLILFLIITNTSRPRILILHSYALDFSWVRDVNTGLNRILKNKPYTLRYHYMDTKRHPDKNYKKHAGITACRMISSWNPDVLIAVDDNAQQFAARNFINKKDLSIVFTGVNKEPSDYGYTADTFNYRKKGKDSKKINPAARTAKNVTGVLERLNYSAIKEILLQILPKGQNRIMHVSDNSPTSEGIHDEIHGFDWSPLKFTHSLQAETFEQWKKFIKRAEQETDFLLLTHYHTIKNENSQVIPSSKVMKWTMENCSIPAVSFWGFAVEDGAMMAIALSPFEQGEMAAKMVVKIINNRNNKNFAASDIPIEIGKLYVIYMRGKQIEEKLGKTLKLPFVYEAFAEATDNYYED